MVTFSPSNKLVLLLGCSFCICVANALPSIAEDSTPKIRPARPQMPASFDRATVAQLLADIDGPRNASILKVGYFLRRGQPALPTDEGFELLQAAAQTELVGTKRWFLLQNLRAFAAFRVPNIDTDQGFEAYQAIFDHAGDAAGAKADYQLRQSVLEFVDSVSGKLNDLGLRKAEQTKALLLQAWTAYATALSSPLNGAALAEPDWTRALEKSESLEAFVPAVEKVIADPAVPKSFGLLMAAASVLAPKDPARAIALWEQAKPLIPQREGRADLDQAARLYQALVDALVARGRLPDAITNQQQFVQLTGRGQGRLLLLTRQSGDGAATEVMLASLVETASDDREILGAASGLFKLARDTTAPDAKAGQQAEALLLSYLASPRPRDKVDEVGARLSLGNFYLRGHERNQARDILDVGPLSAQEQSSPRIKSLLRDVERMKALAEKATGP